MTKFELAVPGTFGDNLTKALLNELGDATLADPRNIRGQVGF